MPNELEAVNHKPITLDECLGRAVRRRGSAASIKDLLDAGADPQVWSNAPIHLACMQGRAKVVAMLMDHGADPFDCRFAYDGACNHQEPAAFWARD